jgi:hypothetical protein
MSEKRILSGKTRFLLFRNKSNYGMKPLARGNYSAFPRMCHSEERSDEESRSELPDSASIEIPFGPVSPVPAPQVQAGRASRPEGAHLCRTTPARWREPPVPRRQVQAGRAGAGRMTWAE